MLMLCACPMMDDDDDDVGDEGSTSTPSEIAGTVARTESAMIAAGRDGVGTVYVAAFAECSLGAELLGAAVIPEADLSSTTSSVGFAIADLPEGTVYLASFLDDDGDADPTMPLPDGGDLVYTDVAGDGMLTCLEVSVGDVNVELELGATEPLPGVSGTVRRGEDVPIAEGNDGIGTLYIGAFDVCAHDGTIVGFTAIPNADVSDPEARIDFAIANIPLDVVHLGFFLDDDGDADPMMPLPGEGDLVYADDVHDGVLSCVEVEAGDEGIDLVLDNVEAE